MTGRDDVEQSLERERSLRRRWLDEVDSLTLELRTLRRGPAAEAIERLREQRDEARRDQERERAARQALEQHLQTVHQTLAASRVGTGTLGDAEVGVLFRQRYMRFLRSAGLEGLSPQELGAPWPVLPRGDVESPDISVVICVRDALDDVRRCLASVARWTGGAFEIVLVDDGSAPVTAAFLARVAARGGPVKLIVNREAPHGYTIAANLGVAAARGRWIVLLNSDTIVTPGWAERIVACGEADPRIGVIGPVSNAATHQSVPDVRDAGRWATNPLPSWLTPEGVGVAVAGLGGEAPRVPFLNGFCYVIRREALEAVGAFDEDRFAAGYCEENDFSIRAASAGFELAVATDAFVYHAKSRSYTPAGRDEHAKRNYAKFLEKHGRETVQRLVSELEEAGPTAGLGSRVGEAIADPGSYARSLEQLAGRCIRPLFVLPGIAKGGSGGSHSIVQEASGLVELGVPARIAIPGDIMDRATSTYPGLEDLFLSFESVADLLSADPDVVVATHFRSVAIVRELTRLRPEIVAAYYIQDYEPFFAAPGSPEAREAEDSYTAIPRQLLFAKTDWLCTVVGLAHGVKVAKVEPSLDRALYRPADESRDELPLVCAMVRPRTPRRQPAATVRLLGDLSRALAGRVRIATFGCEQNELRRLTEDERLLEGHQGVLQRAEVAQLLRSAAVFVDLSVYQAFGRTALEAMSCGCVPVVPEQGGVWEFASPGDNALVVDTADPDSVLRAVAELVSDPSRLSTMRRGAIETASRYSIERASISELALFTAEMQRRAADRAARAAAKRTQPGSAADVLSRYDFGGDELAANATVIERAQSRQGPLERVTWFVPAFDHVYRGGVHTMLRLAQGLHERQGCHAHLVLCGNAIGGHVEDVAVAIRGAFPRLDFSLSRAERPGAGEIERSDIAICTHWTTAYHLLRFNSCDGKYYLVQDFEPAFAAADEFYGLAEATYRFGFPGLANTVGVGDAYAAYGNEVVTFAPGVDREVFRPGELAGGPIRIVFYARPHRPRNGFELGRLALREVKRRHGEAVDIVLAGADFDIREVGMQGIARNAGLLRGLEEVAALYRQSHVGLVFMFTRHPSYQPLEYMASGCATVTNVNAATAWLLRHEENCLVAEPTVTSVADAITRLVEETGTRERLRGEGLLRVEGMDWDTSVAPVIDRLTRSATRDGSRYRR